MLWSPGSVRMEVRGRSFGQARWASEIRARKKHSLVGGRVGGVFLRFRGLKHRYFCFKICRTKIFFFIRMNKHTRNFLELKHV